MTGIICVDKPSDITSFGIVAKVRGITGEKKAGHTGTLDPMATGVLPIMLGGATRFLDYLPDSDKGYRASFVLGKTTDTLDITGNVTGEFPVHSTCDDVKNVLETFKGSIMQVPPMYSAVSVGGKRLYDLARKGIEVERQAREVEIKELELIDYSDNEYTMDVVCSKGTYIRTLVDDIGKVLGCGATMTKLTRTLAMGFTLNDAVTIEELQQMKDNHLSFDGVVTDVEKMFLCYDTIMVSPAQSKRFSNGGALSLDRIQKKLENGKYRVYSPEKEFLGLGECNTAKNELGVKRLLVKRD